MRSVRPLFAYCPCALLLLVAATQPARLDAQTSQYEGKPVANIVFEPRDQPLEVSEIAEILPLKRGEPLRMDTVRAAIARLFATGRYADIQVDAEPYNGGVIVKFITKQSWFIGDISVSGDISSPPNPGQLANATRLELGLSRGLPRPHPRVPLAPARRRRRPSGAAHAGIAAGTPPRPGRRGRRRSPSLPHLRHHRGGDR